MNTSFLKETKFLIILSALLITLASTSSCDESEISPVLPPSNSAFRILPLGDSRVEGARPSFESYRYELWLNLVEGGWDFDFVGSRDDDASYPDTGGSTFDRDHEGTGGATTLDILETVSQLATNNEEIANVVLLGIGGNDLLDSERSPAATIASLREIIAVLQDNNPNVTIFLEQIAPARSDLLTSQLSEILNQFNEEIPTLAASLTSATSQVIVVDMMSGWSDDLMADEVHYNEAGARVIAERYFEAMNTALQ